MKKFVENWSALIVVTALSILAGWAVARAEKSDRLAREKLLATGCREGYIPEYNWTVRGTVCVPGYRP